jgi:hypothetical protein
MGSCLVIEGGKVSGEAVQAVTDAVLSILESPYNDQKTKRMALGIIAKSVQAPAPSNISISGSNFEYSESKAVQVEDDEQLEDFDHEEMIDEYPYALNLEDK